MENDEITLSKEHGVNPSIEICAICDKELGVILFGLLPDDQEAPMKCCLGHVCDDCQKKLEEEKHIVFLEIDNNLYTGRYWRLPEEYITPEALELINDKRVVYISKETFESMEQSVKEAKNE